MDIKHLYRVRVLTLLAHQLSAALFLATITAHSAAIFHEYTPQAKNWNGTKRMLQAVLVIHQTVSRLQKETQCRPFAVQRALDQVIKEVKADFLKSAGAVVSVPSPRFSLVHLIHDSAPARRSSRTLRIGRGPTLFQETTRTHRNGVVNRHQKSRKKGNLAIPSFQCVTHPCTEYG
jgi:hypothetical protein